MDGAGQTKDFVQRNIGKLTALIHEIQVKCWLVG